MNEDNQKTAEINSCNSWLCLCRNETPESKPWTSAMSCRYPPEVSSYPEQCWGLWELMDPRFLPLFQETEGKQNTWTTLQTTERKKAREKCPWKTAALSLQLDEEWEWVVMYIYSIFSQRFWTLVWGYPLGFCEGGRPTEKSHGAAQRKYWLHNDR